MQEINSFRDTELQTACILQHVTCYKCYTASLFVSSAHPQLSVQSPEADHRVRLVCVWREPAEGVSHDVSRENGN